MASRRVTIALLAAAAGIGAATHEREIRVGDKGDAVMRAQILLDRAHFSCGEIDGEFGSNLEKTVTAFQEERHLQPTRTVDAATWGVLNGDQAPALMAYSISADDVKGPFEKIPADMAEQ